MSRSTLAALAALPLVCLCATSYAQRATFELPDGVAMKAVTVWSEGSRLDGDLFWPANMGPDEELPAIVLSHGWGGTKESSRRPAAAFAAAGYFALTISYRTWGASEGGVILLDGMPELDENNEATVRVRFAREVVDPLAQAEDFRAALDYIEGEANVDISRIGAWGTSYGGGLVIWSAARDSRIKAVVSQVGGMGVPWEAMMRIAKRRAIDIARGDAEPIPQNVDRTGDLRGTPHFAKMIRYNAVEVAHRVEVPTLLIDAENEELFDRTQHGMRVYEILRAQGNAPVRYEVVPEISHYDIYGEAFDRSVELALQWFDVHLKGTAAP